MEVKRDTRYWMPEGTIIFDRATVYVGDNIDLATGVFTAPRDGMYHFELSGNADRTAWIYGRVNGVNYKDIVANPVDAHHIEINSFWTVVLNVGDYVTLYNACPCSLFVDDGLFFTFMGYLLK